MNYPFDRSYLRLARAMLLALAVLVAGLAGTIGSVRAAPTDISTTPLGTSTSGTQVQPNIMFILDGSGSTGRDYAPDTVVPTTNDVFGVRSPSDTFTCRTDSTGNNVCRRGEPPFNAGQFNGMAYNPNITYRAAVNADGSSRGDQRNWRQVSEDSFTANARIVDLTTQFQEIGYCPAGSCTPRRNGIHNGTRFAYATPPKPGIAGVQFSRSGSLVTGRTPAVHSIQVDDVIDVIGAGAGGCAAMAVKVASVPTSTTFTYIYGDAQTQPTACGTGAVNFSRVGYPEDSAPSFQTTALVNAARVVTVTFPNHGFFNGDVIDVTGGTNCNTSSGGIVGQVTPNTFSFTSANAAPCSGTHRIARRPANVRTTLGSAPFYYTITPSEYCSDLHLTDCIAATAPTGAFVFPAYVRYCTSPAVAQEAPKATSVAGVATCADKYFPPFVYPRYGMFTRGDIVQGFTYAHPGRTDCRNASACTFDEEMTNFANWFTYYRTRMQAMKSAAGVAFQNLDTSYRAGFILIEPDSLTPATAARCSGSSFLPMATFDNAQKQLFYCALYSQVPSGGTPLREALARVGRYYAHLTDGINAGITDDPVQYSCQQNFSILTTDGQWKTSGNAPALRSGTQVGNVDGNAGLSAGLVSQAAGTYDGGCPDGNVSITGSPGCANTLADVALYYYANDLRTAALGNTAGPNGRDVSTNNVTTNERDPASWQHMVTYTIGLADGLMTWQPDYDSARNGDFFNITSGATGCFWTNNGACIWPMPAAETPTALDDLWHAAVNSHGRYFHATDPQSLANAIANSLAGIKATRGSAAAAATSTPNLTAQSNLAFTTRYATGDWSGQLSARTINLQTGEVSADPLWQADVLLDATDPTARRIFTFDNNQPGKLKAFSYGTFTPTEKAWVDNLCAAPAKLSQCVKLPSTDQATVNNGQTIVDFLRGVNTNAGTLLRARTHRLGDVVDSMPVYVRAPTFNFADAVPRTYADFKNRNSNRQGVVYIGANDGMLHAFNANTGAEMWAYVPRMLIKKMYLLADAGYARSHTYFVDGTPSVMDVFYGGDWHTVLVGGLNAGGAGFYALDITDPGNPVALWEICSDVCDITDPDLGLSFGNPIITKRNGQWVVLLTSGYNNVSGTENLYIVDVVSGTFQKIPTGAGTAASPGGLAKIAAFADNFQLDNTTKYVYGGDLLGNVWRFDLTTPQATALPLAFLADASGKAQPITTRPELGMVRGFRVLYVGTGKYLGASDAPDISPQTLYAFKDTGAPLGNLRQNGLVPKVLTAKDALTRTVAPSTVDWLTQNGWFVDFNLGPGERVNVDPQLTLGTLTVHTNIPNADPCSVGGDSWLYQFSYDTGSYVPTAPGLIVGQKITGSTVVGFVIVSLPGGGLKEIATDALGRNPVFNVPVGTSAGGGRRIGWRELTR